MTSHKRTQDEATTRKFAEDVARHAGGAGVDRGDWLEIATADLCPTCGGKEREGGSVPIAGPDENGQYDTEDCLDEFHS